MTPTTTTNYSEKKESQLENRWDQVYLARLRANHHWDLRHYLHRIDEEVSPLCRRCHDEDDTVSHLFECPGTMAARQKMLVQLRCQSKPSPQPHRNRSLSLAVLCVEPTDSPTKDEDVSDRETKKNNNTLF